MELSEQQIYQTSSQPKKPNSSKPATKLLALLFLLSVLLSFSALLLPAIFNLIQLLSCNVDKCYVFLLFNGIVMLVKVSRSLGHSDEAVDLHGEYTVTRYEARIKEKEMELPEIKEVVVVEEKVPVEEKEIRCVEEKSLVVIGGKNGVLITEDIEDVQGNENNNVNETDEEETGLEELNKRFDDFIRKMKEGIKIEPQQSQLASTVGQ